jgi:hypothetical protein
MESLNYLLVSILTNAQKATTRIKKAIIIRYSTAFEENIS